MKNENWVKEILEGLKNKVNGIKEDMSVSLDIMFSDKQYVLTVWKWTKRLTLIGIGALITTTVTVSNGEYNDMKKELTQKISNREDDLQKFHKDNNKLRIENIELNKQVEIAQAYLELDDNEKEIVDIKIDEVNKATEEQLAQEKAQKEAEEAAKKQAEEEAKRKAEEEEKARKEEEERQKAEAEAHKYETGLTWEQIAREGKNGTLGQFEGKIVQVINGNYGYTQYRIAINGNYDTIMLVEAASYELKETLLEDDYVYFKGKSMGTVSYESVLGAKITIPAFDVDEIHR
ncbi:hypothetical protein [Gemella morbillorum]